MKKFNDATKKGLKFYVYALTYSDNHKDIIFYIGKGKEDKVYSHFDNANEIIMSTLNKDKVHHEDLKNINSFKTDAFIVNAGLLEKEAALIESTLINTMRRFPKQNISNMVVKNRRAFNPTNVSTMEAKISNPIDLQNFCLKNKVNVLVLKTTEESYYSAIEGDFRSVLEGVWKLNKEKIEQVDFVLGVMKGNIFAVYKYIKGSYAKVTEENWTQQEWNRWNQMHISMGRPANHFIEIDGNLNDVIKRNVGVMSLTPLVIPATQDLVLPTHGRADSKEELALLNKAKKLLNRDIYDDKLKKRVTGKVYFGKFEE